MFTGGDEKRQRRGFRDELDAFWEEELRRRPEERSINKYALILAYIRTGLRGVGALALLWATVVLLGGFVSDLRSIDFWYLTIIAFVQAAGLSDAMGDSRFQFFGGWLDSLVGNLTSWGDKHHDERTQLPMEQWLGRQINILLSKIMDITLLLTFLPVAIFAPSGPILCFVLSLLRLRKQDYGIADGDASKANLKPALTLFYCLSLAQSTVSFLSTIIEMFVVHYVMRVFSPQHGFSPEVIFAYWHKTRQMCLNNPASTIGWNLVAYGADLLDSQIPEDYVSGGRVLSMLIDQDTPSAITGLLIRSPRQRIQKLIGTLAWLSPGEQEMRWLAARIVDQLAGHLNLAQFPGALECISSLFDTTCLKSGEQEALYLPIVIDRSKQRKRKAAWEKRKAHLNKNITGNPQKDKHGMLNLVHSIVMVSISNAIEDIRNAGALEQDIKQRGNCEDLVLADIKQRGNCEDLVLAGLGILENLAHDRNNCTLIYNTKDLLSKLLAPVKSNKLVEDIKSNAAWTKLVDGSLKVVSRLMGSPGSTSEEMRNLIAKDSNAMKNLEAILDMDMKSNNSIIELQVQAIDVLTQLALHHPESISETKRTEKIIERALHIFLTTDWMGYYLKDEKRKLDNTLPPRPSTRKYMTTLEELAKDRVAKRAAEAHVEKKMKEAKETASQLKEKAGEALAMLSSDSKAIKSFIACKDDEVRRLTELLNSKIKTIKCKTSATDTILIEINIGCRISAAVILKHLSNYVKEPTLRMVLEELLPKQAQESSTTTPRCWQCAISCTKAACRNDIENPSDCVEDETFTSQSHRIQQCGERRLQAELLSLVANSNLDFAAILRSQMAPATLEDFVVRLGEMVEDNMYATPACLAIQKLTCEMVIEFLQRDENVEVIDKHGIVGTLLEASETMAGLESSMLFAGVDRDCHGVPLKPLSSVLAKNAEDLLAQRKQAPGISTPAAGVPTP